MTGATVTWLWLSFVVISGLVGFMAGFIVGRDYESKG